MTDSPITGSTATPAPAAAAQAAPSDSGLQPGTLIEPARQRAPGTAMIAIDAISKWYGDFRVLHECTTAVAKGEVVVVCGPSGSGKSTLIKCVNALEPFQKGQITVDGTKIADKATNLPKLRSRVGMVFQHFELFPHLSITDNLTIAQRKVLGRPKEEAHKRGLDLLARVGLSAHAKKFPGQLSGGQQQRVAIARALAMNPVVMLFDEPTSALDPEMVGEVLDGDGRARPRGHDHDGRDPRDGLRPQGRRPGDLHGPGRDRRGRRQGRLLRQAALGAGTDLPVEDPSALMPARRVPRTDRSRDSAVQRFGSQAFFTQRPPSSCRQ